MTTVHAQMPSTNAPMSTLNSNCIVPALCQCDVSPKGWKHSNGYLTHVDCYPMVWFTKFLRQATSLSLLFHQMEQLATAKHWNCWRRGLWISYMFRRIMKLRCVRREKIKDKHIPMEGFQIVTEIDISYSCCTYKNGLILTIIIKGLLSLTMPNVLPLWLSNTTLTLMQSHYNYTAPVKWKLRYLVSLCDVQEMKIGWCSQVYDG